MAGRGHSLVLTGLILFGSSFFYGGGVSEEPGWRGYLQNRLQTKLCPLLATIIVWISWALWHLPLDLHSSLGASFSAYLANRFLLLLPLTVIATWLYNRSGQNILTTALFHSAFNTLPDVLPSAPGMSWLLWIWAIAVIVTDRMWRKSDLT
jgi:membrane protease YdiL (CAAX protease family)